jgi:hypothetical protein
MDGWMNGWILAHSKDLFFFFLISDNCAWEYV